MWLAAEARTKEAAIVYESLASAWLRLAADLDRAAILLEDLGEPRVIKNPGK
jgi:hypothetical protein